MKADIHPKYQDAEIRCACGNVIKTRSTRPTIIIGICNACHPFYTGTRNSSIPPGAWINSSNAWPRPRLRRPPRLPTPPPRRKASSSTAFYRPPSVLHFAGGLLFMGGPGFTSSHRKVCTPLRRSRSALNDPKVFENKQRAQELAREYARLKDLTGSGDCLPESPQRP